MTAGIAAALASGEGIETALRLGAAAGTLNVARRGLATGRRHDIDELARHVELRSVAADATRVEELDALGSRRGGQSQSGRPVG
jgi:hypothetical protein